MAGGSTHGEGGLDADGGGYEEGGAAAGAPDQPVLGRSAATLLLTMYVACAAASTVLTTASRSKVTGRYEYCVISATLASETLKLVTCLCILARRVWLAETRAPGSGGRAALAHYAARVLESRAYALPAATYLLDNNIAFVVLAYMRPSEAALLSNVSVLVTALVFRSVMRRTISRAQWSALTQLMLGLMVSRIAGGVADGGGDTMHALNPGHFFLLLQVGLSAFANVYTERVLKDWRQEELALQNALLYAYGAGLNALALFPTAAAQGRLSDPFGGWNAYTFALVFATATTGLLTSVVLKHLSTMAKVLASGTIMIATVLLSAAAFGREPHLAFYLAVALVINALVAYNQPTASPAAERAMSAREECTLAEYEGEELLPP